MAITKVTSGLISADAASVDLNIDAGTLYIDATNNRVGVGNTSPDLKLHVAHSDSNNGLLLEHTSQASGHQYLLNARQTEGLIFQRWTNGSFSSNTMTLDYNNRVGIGTTVPSQALTVSNTSGGISALIQTSTTGTGNLLFGDTDSDTSGRVQYQHTGNLMAFHTNGLERMKIDSSGLVTMTTEPAQATQERVLFLDVNCIGNQGSGYLEIHSGTNTTAKTRIEQVSSGGSGLYGTYIDTNIINVGNSASAHGNINFITNQAIRMTVGAGPNAGRVGIGTTSPSSILHLYANDPQILLDDSGTQSSITGQSGNILYKTSSVNRDHVFFGVSTEVARITGDANFSITGGNWSGADRFNLSVTQFDAGATFQTGEFLLFGDHDGTKDKMLTLKRAGSDVFTVDAGGLVGIGTSSPSAKLHIAGDDAFTALTIKDNTSSADMFSITCAEYVGSAPFNMNKLSASNSSGISFETGGSERMRIDSSGLLTVKSTTTGAGGGQIALQPSNASTADNEDYGFVSFRNNSETTLAQIKGISEGTGNNKSHIEFSTSDGSLGMRMRIRDNGTVQVIGALSKGSGSFEIEHPLESKRETHLLRHSFIEGPQCDNIYRGTVTLTDGSATVNLDSVSNMTNGTFVALNTDVQVFTTNETDWDAVKGSVSGNILTITCQNSSSTATVSWLVIAERQDDNIISSAITDEYGKLVVEPEVYEGGT